MVAATVPVPVAVAVVAVAVAVAVVAVVAVVTAVAVVLVGVGVGDDVEVAEVAVRESLGVQERQVGRRVGRWNIDIWGATVASNLTREQRPSAILVLSAPTTVKFLDLGISVSALDMNERQRKRQPRGLSRRSGWDRCTPFVPPRNI